MNEVILKKLIYTKLHELVQDKIDNSDKAIQSAIESRDSETKSSAGDKYETGRAMMHLEQQRNEIQRSKAIQLKNQLNQIDIDKPYTKVENGAFVITNQGNYFIAIGLGKVKVQDSVIYCISLQSPIGKILQHKQVKDTVKFNRKEITILDIK